MKLTDQLVKDLARRGWDIVRHHADLEWWAVEIWEVESRWSPSGFKVYLTLCRDPQPDGDQPFLEIGCCPHWPLDRFEAAGEPCLSFRGWVEQLPLFLEGLNDLRKLTTS